MTATIEGARSLLSAAAALAAKSARAKGISAQDFLAAARLMRRQPARDGRAFFNILAVLGFGADETRHTQALAWLLAEDQTHGHGNLFFRACAAALALPLETELLTDYDVRAEFAGQEAVTDIVIYRRCGFVLAIENKVHAAEGRQQIAREQRDMDRLAEALRVPRDKCFGVFLTPDGRPPLTAPEDRQWRSISHGELADAILAVRGEVRDAKLAAFVEDLCEYVKHWGEAE